MNGWARWAKYKLARAPGSSRRRIRPVLEVMNHARSWPPRFPRATARPESIRRAETPRGGERRSLQVEISARRCPAYAGCVVLVLLSGSFALLRFPDSYSTSCELQGRRSVRYKGEIEVPCPSLEFAVQRFNNQQNEC